MEENDTYSPRLRSLLNKARTTWLLPIEYAEILESFEPEPAAGGSGTTLCNWKSPFAPLFVTTSFETPPPSGTLYIYDRAWLTKQRIKIKIDGHAWKTRGGSYQREDTVNLEVLSTKAPRPKLCSSSGEGGGPRSEEVARPVGETSTGITAPARSVERKVNLLGQYAHHATSSRFHRRTYHLGRSGGAAAAAAAAVAAVACLGTAEEANVAAANAAKRRVEDLHIVHYLEDHAPVPKPQNSASRPSSRSSKSNKSNFSSSSSSEYGIEASTEASSSGGMWGDDVSAFADLMTEAMADDGDFGDNCEALLGGSDFGGRFNGRGGSSDLSSNPHHTGSFEFSSEEPSGFMLPPDNNSSTSPTPRVETPPLPRPPSATHGNIRSFDSHGAPFESVSDHSMASIMAQNSSNNSCCILDLAPECCDAAGGTKMLLVLSEPVPRDVRDSGQSSSESLSVGFYRCTEPSATELMPSNEGLRVESMNHSGVSHRKGDSSRSGSTSGWTWVEGSAVGLTAVRCLAPTMHPGPAQVVVARHVPSLNRHASGGKNASSDLWQRQFLTPFDGDALTGAPRVVFCDTDGATHHNVLRPLLSSTSAKFASIEDNVAVSPLPPVSQAPVTSSGSQGCLSRNREEDGLSVNGSAWVNEEQERKIRAIARPELSRQQSSSLDAFVPTSGVSSNSGSNNSYNSDSSSSSGKTDDTSGTSGASAVGNVSFISKDCRSVGGAEVGEEIARTAGLDGFLVDGEALPELLDDASLHQLGELELEDVLERLLMRVVQQMVLLAAGDDDLKEELNAPDKSGLCLLHYASLYNLLPLVPILLKHGARVDEATVSLEAQTPLHLAAGAGHAAVVEALVGHGAPLATRDGAGFTPRERALAQGQHHVAARLHQLANGSSPDYAPSLISSLEQAALHGTSESTSSNRLESSIIGRSGNEVDTGQRTLHTSIGGALGHNNTNDGMMSLRGQTHDHFGPDLSRMGHGAPSTTSSPVQISGKRTMREAEEGGGGVAAAAAGAVAALTLPTGSPGSSSGHLGLTLQNVAMLQDAFTTLSLKEKCLLRSGVARHSLNLGLSRGISSNASTSHDGSSGDAPAGKLGLAAATWAAIEAAANAAKSEHGNNSDDGSGGVESEVASVITDSDKESLDVAMAMMEPNERAEVEKEARVLQKNMKAWMMRRNYKAMRDSARKLQFLWRENKASATSDNSSSSSINSSGGGSSNRRRVQRASSGSTGIGSALSHNTCGAERSGGLDSIDEHSAEHLGSSSSFSSDDGSGSSSGVSTNRVIFPRASTGSKDLAVSSAGSGSSMELFSEGHQVKGAENEGSGDEELGLNEGSTERDVNDDDDDENDDRDHEGVGEDQTQEEAGRKLQAGARGMLARRNFRRIKRQTLAMIVIQRTLLRRRNRASSFADLSMAPPMISNNDSTGEEAAATEMVLEASSIGPNGLPLLLSSTSSVSPSPKSREASREALSSFWALESGGVPP